MFTATLIAERGLSGIADDVRASFAGQYNAPSLRVVRTSEPDRAVDLVFPDDQWFWGLDRAELTHTLRDIALAIAARNGLDLALDVIVQPSIGREKRLLVADMDSTMITVECIDELADYAGLKAEVAAITERAMLGELDFEAALDARVRLLEGMPADTIDRCREERVRITPGARVLVRTMRARGATCILVSGGFTRFAEPVAAEIGFDRAVANVLEIEDGRLTGEVRRPIVGAASKQQVLIAAARELGIPLEATMAVGDGANDIPMLDASGRGVAYRAKPAVREAADAVIDYNDLTALLYAQGIPRSEWARE